ncbi:hypothetical protein BBO99_00004153 [Phytophthora kernoviae]|uniref:Dynein light chain n=2 Tax=Phytophthora kernoviae TaxID=325452 RepID=A0A3R7MXR3_9STRA|nr:hypothetical protein G195_005717 [Phytophthora kernoviae 00238/432]KAG2523559.1 hypothetical protein JM18_004484 [Phytophthora kernoviae]KAG2526363.1 hypothetical protein JM16_003883 [Phytophthora kernoviae]RLN46329.1 hypothetical protein BBI17_004847 [Phytophthora kernoviae]RLN80895.1 hypothetical protein BBO99_00004153 [Phytophthora kernoviae]
MSLPSSSPTARHQSAKIQLLTVLNDCYWKNGRKNLQCFPSCPEHHDFYSMKMNNRKHSSVGVCRGPVYCHAFTNAAEFFPASASQLELEQLAGASSSSGSSNNNNVVSELFVLGRFERVPQQESTNLLEELHPPPSFQTAAAFEQFRYNCFQAVEMEERRVLLPEGDQETCKHGMVQLNADKKNLMRSTWFFLPDVWKLTNMGPPDASKSAGEDGTPPSSELQDGVGSGKVPKITIMRLELGTEMKNEAVAHLIQILQTTPNAIEKDIATDMKKYFDQKYGQTWHCIVGKGFGCSIAYDTQYLLFFRADKQYVLLFKSTE